MSSDTESVRLSAMDSELRTYCLRLPRHSSSTVGAIYDTKWNVTNAGLFAHVLDQIHSVPGSVVSLELFARNQMVYLCIAGRGIRLDALVAATHAVIHKSELVEVEDYAGEVRGSTHCAIAELTLSRRNPVPLQTYEAFAYDSLAPLLSCLTNVALKERMLFQILLEPVVDSTSFQFSLWKDRQLERAHRCVAPRFLLKKDIQRSIEDRMRSKCSRRLFRTSIRIAAWEEDQGPESLKARAAAQERLCAQVRKCADTFKTTSTIDFNQLEMLPCADDDRRRTAVVERRLGSSMLLSAVEITTFWHPVWASVLPNSEHLLSHRFPPPRELPRFGSEQTGEEICYFGHSNYRGQRVAFGLTQNDRSRGMLIMGADGCGKSRLLQRFIEDDLSCGRGCLVLDGDGALFDRLQALKLNNGLTSPLVLDPRVDGDLRLDLLKSEAGAFDQFWPSVLSTCLGILQRGPASPALSQFLGMVMEQLLKTPTARIESLLDLMDPLEGQAPGNGSRGSHWGSFAQPSLAALIERNPEISSFLENNVRPLFQHYSFKAMFDQLPTSEDLDSAYGSLEDRVLLVRGASEGLTREQQECLRALVLFKACRALCRQTDTSRQSSYTIYIDDLSPALAAVVQSVLPFSRRFGIRFFISTKASKALPSDIFQLLLSNVGNIVSFRMPASDAASLVDELKPLISELDIANLPPGDFFARLHLRGKLGDPFSGSLMDESGGSHSAAAEVPAAYVQVPEPSSGFEAQAALAA